MTKILIYGGCHARILQRLLSRVLIGKVSVDVIINYEIIGAGIPFPLKSITEYDHFIYSPIVNKDLWNTRDIVDFCVSKGINSVGYPWLQWNGYFPGAQKMSFCGIDAWFYKFIIDEVNNYTNIDEFIEAVVSGGIGNIDIEKNLVDTTRRLKEHETKNNTDVIISDYIISNYKTKRLFLTPDHPSKIIYQEILKRILPKIGGVYWPHHLFKEPQNEAWTPILPYVEKNLNLNFSNTMFRANGGEPCSLVRFLTALYEHGDIEKCRR